MHINNFIPQAKELVARYVNSKFDTYDLASNPLSKITANEVMVTWQSKTLQNAKALVITQLRDGMYYEVTYNGDKDEIYFDVYEKVENIKIDVKEV